MKGLILKDILNLRPQLKIFGLMILIYAVIFIPTGQADFISGFITVISAVIVVTTISYDDLAKWDRFALTMPITRKEVVLSKYVSMLLFSIAGAIIASIFNIAGGYINKDINIAQVLLTSVASLSTALIFGSIILPLLYKFGVEKARFFIILCALIPTAIVVVGVQILNRLDISIPIPSEDLLENMIYLIPVVAMILVVVSYFITLKIYIKKEF